MKKNVIVRQQDLKDCGVCSLLSIIKHYEGYIPIEKLRQDTQTSLEGTTAYHLVETAKNYGFDSYGVRLEKIEELDTIILPAIAHVKLNNLNHFVVIYKITKQEIIIMDPARGKVKMKKEDFENIWSKNIIILYPKYELPKITNDRHTIQMLFEIVKKDKKTVCKIISLTLLFTLFTIATGFYFKIVTNFLNQNEDKKLITILITLFLFLYFIKFIIYYLRNYFKALFNKNVDGILYYDFLKHLFLLPNYFVKDRTTGEIMLRMKELENIKDVFSEILVIIFLDSILAFSVGIILYRLNKTLFLLLCLFVFIYTICGIISGHILYKKALNVNDAEVQFQSRTIDDLDSFISIKNLNIVSIMFQKIEICLFKYLNCLHKMNQSIIKTNTLNFSIEELLNFFILSLGFIEILNKSLNIVDLITFESLVIFFVNPFKNMINLLPNYNYVKVSIEKISDFYNIPEEQKEIGLKEFKKGDITIKDLTFSYTPFSKLLENVNLTIKENTCVLFKGSSGCGKSTLCQIICRLIETNSSKIKINDVNINDYSLETIRKNITYVSQKENLMQDTIKNNILLYRNINEERFMKIMNLCEIEEIINKKPLRFETFLAKDSINISGGEKQRIILARALLNDFQILILDEALSEVNSDLEIKIIKNIKSYFKDKTIIYVSHKNHDKYFDKVYDFGASA